MGAAVRRALAIQDVGTIAVVWNNVDGFTRVLAVVGETDAQAFRSNDAALGIEHERAKGCIAGVDRFHTGAEVAAHVWVDQLDVGYDALIALPNVRVLHAHAILGVVLAMHVLAHALEHGALQDDAVGAAAGVDVAQGEFVKRPSIAQRRAELQARTAWGPIVAAAVQIELLEVEPAIGNAVHALDDDHVLTAGANPADLGVVAVGTPRHALVLPLLQDNGGRQLNVGARIEHREKAFRRAVLQRLPELRLVARPDERAGCATRAGRAGLPPTAGMTLVFSGLRARATERRRRRRQHRSHRPNRTPPHLKLGHDLLHKDFW